MRHPLVLAAGVVALWAFGLWALLPYVLEEHRRMEPWQIPWHWAGDAVALLWLVRFAAASVASGDTGTRPLRRGEEAPRLALMTLTLVGGALVELSVTAHLAHQERAGYAAGIPVEADVLAMRTRTARLAAHHEMRCRFLDGAGRTQEAVVAVHAWRGRLPDALPPGARDALARGEAPRTLPIRYAAARPARAWVDGIEGIDENRFVWMSLFLVWFQALGSLAFLLHARRSLPAHVASGIVPWWRHAAHALPFTVEAVILALFGAVTLAKGWR